MSYPTARIGPFPMNRKESGRDMRVIKANDLCMLYTCEYLFQNIKSMIFKVKNTKLYLLSKFSNLTCVGENVYEQKKIKSKKAKK